MVRDGLVLSAPHFSTKHGPGSTVDPDLFRQWTRFDLASALNAAFRIPTKLANDADIQGAAVVKGVGLELVITLGTGFGSGLFYNGQLMPHLEIAHQPFRKGETYNDQLGEPTRKEIGEERWNKRVHKAIVNLRALLLRPPLHRRRQLAAGDPTKSRRRHNHYRQQRRYSRRYQVVGRRPHWGEPGHPVSRRVTAGPLSLANSSSCVRRP